MSMIAKSREHGTQDYKALCFLAFLLKEDYENIAYAH